MGILPCGFVTAAFRRLTAHRQRGTRSSSALPHACMHHKHPGPCVQVDRLQPKTANKCSAQPHTSPQQSWTQAIPITLFPNSRHSSAGSSGNSAADGAVGVLIHSCRLQDTWLSALPACQILSLATSVLEIQLQGWNPKQRASASAKGVSLPSNAVRTSDIL